VRVHRLEIDEPTIGGLSRALAIGCARIHRLEIDEPTTGGSPSISARAETGHENVCS
jgi:hypothetical protein